MTPYQINLTIAAQQGWRCDPRTDLWYGPNGEKCEYSPDYYSDLNLWFHIEQEMTDEEFNTYCLQLCGLQDAMCYPPTIKDLRTGINATAADKCKAYLKMKGLWV